MQCRSCVSGCSTSSAMQREGSQMAQCMRTPLPSLSRSVCPETTTHLAMAHIDKMKCLQALGCCRYKSPLLAMLHNVKLTLGGLCRSTVTDWYWVIHVLTKHHSTHMCMQTDKRVREHWQQKLRLWCKLATTFGAASF